VSETACNFCVYFFVTGAITKIFLCDRMITLSVTVRSLSLWQYDHSLCDSTITLSVSLWQYDHRHSDTLWQCISVCTWFRCTTARRATATSRCQGVRDKPKPRLVSTMNRPCHSWHSALVSTFCMLCETVSLPSCMISKKEHNVLLQLKGKEHEARGLPFDGEFYI